MNIWKALGGVLVAGLGVVLGVAAVPAADTPPPAPEGTLILIDSAGKEQKLKTWKFVTGTRRLSWLAPAAPPKEGEEKAPGEREKPKAEEKKPLTGPEALAFRDDHSTTFVDGILTLIPLERLRSLDYDDDKETVTVHVATNDKPDDDVVLTGSTKFRGINKLAIEAEVDKGDLGVAEVKFLGGVPHGIRGIRFPAPRAANAAPEGRGAEVTTADKDQKTTEKVGDLQPLYRFADDSERGSPLLFFKKTLKVDVNKVQKLRAVEEKEAEGSAWGVTLKGGEEETYTLLPKPTLDGRPATLAGFVGKVPVGYKLLPVHTIAEIQFDEGK